MPPFDADLRSLGHHSRLSRRAFAASGIGMGFAAATLPVAAATITTPATGLVAGPVTVPVPDGEIPAYRARPEGAGPFPTILVAQEIFGVHEHIQDVCRRLAREGYFAIAPALYARQGDVGGMTDIRRIIDEVVARVPDDQVMGDLDATRAFAEAEAEADAGRLGITGFCWGGRIVWLYAAHQPALGAGVAWYGRLVGESSPRTPEHPVDVAGALQAPVLGLYGGADRGIPLDTVEAMRERLDQAGAESRIVVYPEAPHGFHADYRPSYREEAARDAWQRCLAWFREHGVG